MDGPIPPYFWPLPGQSIDDNFLVAVKTNNLTLAQQLVSHASAQVRAQALIDSVMSLKRSDSLTKSVALVNLIRRHSFDLELLNLALHQAIVYGHSSCIRQLKELGAKIYSCNLTQALLQRQNQIFTRSMTSLWQVLVS